LRPFPRRPMIPIVRKCESGFGRMESWSRRPSKRSVVLRHPGTGITPRHHRPRITTDGGDGRLYLTFPFTMGDPTAMGITDIDLTAVGITGIDPTSTGDLGTIVSWLRFPKPAGWPPGLLPIPTKAGHCTGGRCYSISCRQDGRDLLFLFLPI